MKCEAAAHPSQVRAAVGQFPGHALMESLLTFVLKQSAREAGDGCGHDLNIIMAHHCFTVSASLLLNSFVRFSAAIDHDQEKFLAHKDLMIARMTQIVEAMETITNEEEAVTVMREMDKLVSIGQEEILSAYLGKPTVN